MVADFVKDVTASFLGRFRFRRSSIVLGNDSGSLRLSSVDSRLSHDWSLHFELQGAIRLSLNEAVRCRGCTFLLLGQRLYFALVGCQDRLSCRLSSLVV